MTAHSPSAAQTALACLPKSRTGSTHRPAVASAAEMLHARLTGRKRRSPDPGCSRHLESSKWIVAKEEVKGRGVVVDGESLRAAVRTVRSLRLSPGGGGVVSWGGPGCGPAVRKWGSPRPAVRGWQRCGGHVEGALCLKGSVSGEASGCFRGAPRGPAGCVSPTAAVHEPR